MAPGYSTRTLRAMRPRMTLRGDPSTAKVQQTRNRPLHKTVISKPICLKDVAAGSKRVARGMGSGVAKNFYLQHLDERLYRRAVSETDFRNRWAFVDARRFLNVSLEPSSLWPTKSGRNGGGASSRPWTFGLDGLRQSGWGACACPDRAM